MKNLSLVFTLGLLSACATTATTDNFKKYHDSAVGKKIDLVMDLWGYPSSEFTAPNGNKVYVFYKSRHSQGHQLPSHTTINMIGNTAYATTQPGAVVGGGTRSCKAWVEVDTGNNVVDWRAEGNACKLDPDQVK